MVNLSVLDMLSHNQVYSKLDLTHSFATYSHPAYQGIDEHSHDHQPSLTQPLIQSITQHILGTNFNQQYYAINQALYTSLLAKHKVMLGGMPDTLYR